MIGKRNTRRTALADSPRWKRPATMRSRLAVFTAALVSFFAASSAAPAKADALDDLLTLLATVGVIDHAVVEAKPVIECVIGGGGVIECADAVAHVKAEAKSALSPNDPRIKQVIDIFNAVQAGDWLKVFKLGGSQVACGVVPGGTVKDFFCGPIADKVFAVAGDKMDAIYTAVSKGDWWGLIKLADPSIVCALMPEAVEKILCNEFAAAVGKALEYAASAPGAVYDGINNAGDWIAGQSQHIPPGDYYIGLRRELLHDLVIRQASSLSVDGVLNARIKTCVEYFDSHKMSESNANKVCNYMRGKLKEEINLGADFAIDAVDAYFLSRLQPHARAFAAAEYARLDAIKAKVELVKSSGYQWRGSTFDPVSPPFGSTFNACRTETRNTFTLPAPSDGHSNAVTIYNWICYRAAGEKFSAELLKAKAWLDNDLTKQLAACSRSVLGGGQILFSCDTYQSMRRCRDTFAGLGVASNKVFDHCRINENKATPNEAARIARELGAKRCRVDGAGATTAAVVCERSWKRRACAAILKESTAGLSYLHSPPKCIYEVSSRGAGNFNQLVADAKAIAAKLNGALPARSGSAQDCRVLADPLAIRCKGIPTAQQASALVAGLSLPGCPPDPNNDGADAPCYSPLTDIKWSQQQLGNQPLVQQPLDSPQRAQNRGVNPPPQSEPEPEMPPSRRSPNN